MQPTHLDWHCLLDGGREDVFDVTLALAEEYRLGVRAWTEHGRAALRAHGYTAQDHPFLDSFSISPEGKLGTLISRIRQLRDGLSEWAVHPAQGAAAHGGADVRRTDYDVLMADATRQVLADEGIVILGYGDARLRAPVSR